MKVIGFRYRRALRNSAVSTRSRTLPPHPKYTVWGARTKKFIYFSSAAWVRSVGISSALHFMCLLCREIPQSPSHARTHKRLVTINFVAIVRRSLKNRKAAAKNRKMRSENVCRTHNAFDPPCTWRKEHGARQGAQQRKFIHLWGCERGRPKLPFRFIVDVVIQSREFYGLFAVYQIHVLFCSPQGSFCHNFFSIVVAAVGGCDALPFRPQARARSKTLSSKFIFLVWLFKRTRVTHTVAVIVVAAAVIITQCSTTFWIRSKTWHRQSQRCVKISNLPLSTNEANCEEGNKRTWWYVVRRATGEMTAEKQT